jgi:drug/metabolite transporter (DMT)-like permease
MPQGSWTAHAVLSLAWGLSFVFGLGVVGGFGWAAAAMLTSAVVALGIAVAARLGGHPLSVRPGLRRATVLGAWLAVQSLGMCLALSQLGLSLTAIVLGTTPLFASVIGQMWGVERITPTGVLGLVVGFLGLLLVVLFPAHGDGWDFIAGMLACLLSAFAAAFATRYADQRLPRRPGPVATAHVLAAAIAAPVALLSGGSWPTSPLGFASLVGLALVVTLAGPTLYARMADGTGVATAGVKTAGMVLAMLVGVVFLGEGLSFGQVVGMLFVLIGAGLVLGLVPTQSFARWSR